ncbi:hypothetical protein [Enterococcus faecalis]|nr:hypothetical protein [Enterococcus faecalis]MEB7776300.1 hypothetical protein [Enterococcus faecalis]
MNKKKFCSVVIASLLSSTLLLSVAPVSAVGYGGPQSGADASTTSPV